MVYQSYQHQVEYQLKQANHLEIHHFVFWLVLWRYRLLRSNPSSAHFFVFPSRGHHLFLMHQLGVKEITKLPPVWPPPVIVFTSWEAPSEAKPDIPSVFAIVGVKVRPRLNMLDNRLPLTCFLILVLASLISFPLLSCRFFRNLLATFCGTCNTSFRDRAFFESLRVFRLWIALGRFECD